MKKTLAFLVILLLVGASAFAQTVVFQQGFSGQTMLPKAHGDWEVKGGRLYQSDTEERLAKVNVMAPQSGDMQYEFNLRYEGGGFEDMMGGFGVHIFVDKAWDGKSWGNGNSMLLWLNYDASPNAGYPAGFTAQVYKSTSETKMELIGQFDLNRYAYLLNAANMSVMVPVRIKVNGSTGSVWVEDPTLPGYGYRFGLGQSLGRGNYVALRTNSLAVSYDNLKVTKLK
ncbi:MAG: hypothetical protein HN368_12090 [Spirochaetales bacterium]|jgi:hypothetical protein|nr:hypothetical protein [Spirochaetales bacterium]